MNKRTWKGKQNTHTHEYIGNLELYSKNIEFVYLCKIFTDVVNVYVSVLAGTSS